MPRGNHSHGTPRKWTAQMDAEMLRMAYTAGLRAKVIAALLTVQYAPENPITTNAVIGRLHRLRHISDNKQEAAAQLVRRTSRMRHVRITYLPATTKIVKALFDEMNKQQCTMKRMETGSGVSRYAIFRWRRHDPRIGDLAACWQVLGFKLNFTTTEITDGR